MEGNSMTEDEVRNNGFAMPMHNPAFPPGPYRFVDREFLIITYRTDPDKLRKISPAPLEMVEPIVKYEFINMPDSTGFGHYCESGQVIPVTLNGVAGGYVHSMYLNDHPPIAAGRELWGFPKKLGEPELRVHKDTLVGTLDYSETRVATGTMGFKHKTLDHKTVLASMAAPAFLLKIIPHVDGTPRICELVQYSLTDIVIKGAWSGPGALDLNPHALAPVADLPVLEVLSATHILADLTLPYGTVAYDYLNR
jgi:acetoacetate decarboxylase